MQVVDSARLDVFEGFLGVLLAEGSEEIPHHFHEVILLVRAEIPCPDSLQAGFLAGQLDRLVAPFAPTLAEQGDLALLAIEHLVDLVGGDGLVPVGVFFVLGTFVEALASVAVEDGPPEGGPFHRVTVAAAGAVATAQDELELAGSGFAEDRYRGTAFEAFDSAVPLDLVEDLLGVFLAVDSHEDALDHGLLILGEALHLGLGDLPVVVHLQAQLVIEGEADHLALLVAQGIVEGLHQGFRRVRGRFLLGGEGGDETGSPDSRGGTCGSAEEGSTAGGGGAIWAEVGVHGSGF